MNEYFEGHKVKPKQVFDFFGSRFDMRNLPKGVRIKVMSSTYCIAIGEEMFSDSVTDVDEELSDKAKRELEEVLKLTPGLYELFMSEISTQSENLISQLGSGSTKEVEGVIQNGDEKTLKERQNFLKQKYWKFFENKDSPVGIDAYIYMSSKIVKQEELAGDLFRIVRDYYFSKGLEPSHRERMSIWTLKDFLDNHLTESTEVELRLTSSKSFEESLERIKFWVDNAWNKIVSSGISPMMEKPVEWLEEDKFFKSSDGLIEDMIKRANELQESIDNEVKTKLSLCSVDTSDSVFNTKVGREILKEAKSNNLDEVLNAAKAYLKNILGGDLPKEEIKELLKQVEDVQSYCAKYEQQINCQVRNEHYNPEAPDKLQMELEADMAMEELLSDWQ